MVRPCRHLPTCQFHSQLACFDAVTESGMCCHLHRHICLTDSEQVQRNPVVILDADDDDMVQSTLHRPIQALCALLRLLLAPSDEVC